MTKFFEKILFMVLYAVLPGGFIGVKAEDAGLRFATFIGAICSLLFGIGCGMLIDIIARENPLLELILLGLASANIFVSMLFAYIGFDAILKKKSRRAALRSMMEIDQELGIDGDIDVNTIRTR